MEIARRFSEGKAKSIGIPGGQDHFIIGADQTLEGPDGQLLRKPEDPAERLRLLAGQTHLLHSGLCLRYVSDQGDETLATVVVSTILKMRPLERMEIQRYLATEDVTGSVTGYRYEGLGVSLMEEIEFLPTEFPNGTSAFVGDDSAIVGLPMLALFRLMRLLQGFSDR